MTPVNIELAFGATGTTKSQMFSEHGVIGMIKFVVPDFTNVVTAHVAVKDKTGYALYTSAEKAKNATYLLDSLEITVHHRYTLEVVLSGNAGGDGGTVEGTAFVY